MLFDGWYIILSGSRLWSYVGFHFPKGSKSLFFKNCSILTFLFCGSEAVDPPKIIFYPDSFYKNVALTLLELLKKSPCNCKKRNWFLR